MLCNECAHFTVCKFLNDANHAMELVEEVAETPNPLRLEPRCDMFMERQQTVKQNKFICTPDDYETLGGVECLI